MTGQSSTRSAVLAEAAVLALLAVFHFATLRAGHYWGDDFAHYVRHAANIAAGRPYAETPWIRNPYYPELSPPAYPPVYPLLLAPLVKAYGIDLEPLKWPGVAALLAAVFLLNRLARSRLPHPVHLVPGLLFALNPFLWDFKDYVQSDLPFVALALAAVLFVERAHATGAAHPLRDGVVLGLLLCLAYETRAAGAVLAGALVLADVLRGRRLRGLALPATVVFVGVVLLVHTLVLPTQPVAGYWSYFHTGPRIVAANVAEYVGELGGFWDNGYADAGTALVFVAATALAGAGLWGRLRPVPGPLEVFVALYGTALLFWPGDQQGIRMLLPVLPAYCLYVVEGACRLHERRAGAGKWLWALGAVVVLAYAGRYTRLDWGRLRVGIGTEATQGLFRYVGTELPPDAVVVFRKPRALALFTGRRATMYHPPERGRDLWAWLREAGVTHVVTGRNFDLDREVLIPFVRAGADRLERVWGNETFDVYRVR